MVFRPRLLAIDSSLAESQALLGLLAATVDHDCQEALRQFQLATAHQPVSPYVRWFHGQFLGHIRKYDEAIQQLQQALQADPLDLLCRSHLAQWLHVVGNREAAVQQLRMVFEVDPTFGVARFYLGIFEALDGNLVEARAAVEKNSHSTALGLLAGIASRQGDASVTNEALALLRSGNPYALPIGWTAYHLVRLEFEEAADWLTRAIEQRDPRVLYLLPYVRTSSQWPKLAKMMNLPQAI